MSRILTRIDYPAPDALPGVEVVPMRNAIVIDGRPIRLTALQADLAFALWKGAPAPLPFDRLWLEIYDGKPGRGRKERGPRRKTMFRHLYDLKTRLKGTRVAIESVAGGYRMTATAAPAAAPANEYLTGMRPDIAGEYP